MREAMIDTRVVRMGYLAATMAIFLGIWARLRNLLQTPMWLDEAYSRFAAQHDLWFLWDVVPRYETHPPFYYSLLHLWRLAAGDSLLAYRTLGLICGFATMMMIGLATRALARRMSAPPPVRAMMTMFGLACAALSPMLISMSRQVRPYPEMILVYAMAVLALLRLDDDAAQGSALARRWIVTFFVLQTLILWLHAFGALFALTMSLALLLCMMRRGLSRAEWVWLAGAQLCVGLCYLPGVAILRSEAPAWIRSTWLIFDPSRLPTDLSALFAGPWGPLGAFAFVSFAVGIVQFLRLKKVHRAGAALVVMTLLPVALSLLISWWAAPVFLPRTLSPVVVPFILCITMLATNERLRLVGPVLVAMLLALSLRYDFDDNAWQPIEGWYRAVDWIAPKVAPGDAIWAYPNETALPLGYALAERARPLPIRQIPVPVPALGYPGEHPTGNGGVVSVNPADIRRIADDPATVVPHSIWLVGLAAERVDPRDLFLHALLRDRTIGRRYKDNEIRILELVAKPPASTPGRAAPAGASAAH